MLKNVTKQDIEVSYNQIVIVVNPGKFLDVRDFRISKDQILDVEKHLIFKFPEVFEQSKTKEVGESTKEYEDKIDSLEKECKELKDKADEALKGCAEAEKKMQKVITENEGLKSKNESLSGEVKELKAKLKAVS